MRILLTGANGFLGGIIAAELEKTHQIISLGRGKGNQISCDLAKEIPQVPEVDMIVHAAGKAHVIPKTEAEKAEFYEVNLGGTANLLKGISNPPKSFVFISTVAVYGVEDGTDISESSPLLGNSPYAQSKIEAEKLVTSWGEENQVNVLILRLPLIVGANPPGNLGAIIRAIKRGFYRRIGDGSAKKSMVLAADIACALPDWFDKSGIYNLTDGAQPSMMELDGYLASQFGRSVKTIPLWPLQMLAKLGDLVPGFPLNTYRLSKLSHSLTFSDLKAKTELGWTPRPVIGNFIP